MLFKYLIFNKLLASKIILWKPFESINVCMNILTWRVKKSACSIDMVHALKLYSSVKDLPDVIDVINYVIWRQCFLKNNNEMVLTLHHLLVYGNVTELAKNWTLYITRLSHRSKPDYLTVIHVINNDTELPIWADSCIETQPSWIRISLTCYKLQPLQTCIASLWTSCSNAVVSSCCYTCGKLCTLS